MTDPRVQRARDALEDAYHNLHESDIVRDLLAVVDDHRKVLDAQQDKWMRESVRAEAAEAEVERLREKLVEMANEHHDDILTRYATLEDDHEIAPGSAEGRAYFTGYQDGVDAGIRSQRTQEGTRTEKESTDE